MNLNQPQLFLDDELIGSAFRLQRKIHPPLMMPEPILKPEKPWELNAVTLYGTVVQDPESGLYRMYYNSFAKSAGRTIRNCVCMAVSKDGLHWDRPNLGIISYEGSRDNNIILEPPEGYVFIDSPTIIYEIEEPNPKKRYKLSACVAMQDKMFCAFSEDGIHWKWHKTDLDAFGDRRNLCPVKIDGKYVLYCRHWDMFEPDKGTWGRSCWVSTSEDFINWTEPELVLSPDLTDSVETQFYAMAGFSYQDQYLGWVQRLWSDTDTLDLELISSRDGFNWQRIGSREPFIPLGPKGSWYSTWVDLPSSAPIQINNSLYWYVGGRAHSHIQDQPMPSAAIGLAVQPVDTMVSLHAGSSTGQLTTKAITWPGEDLWLHIRKPRHASFTGGPSFFSHELSVRVLDENNLPIKGFENSITQKPKGDDYVGWHWHRILWQDGRISLSQLAGKKVKIQIRWSNADLYGFRSAPENLPSREIKKT